MTSPAPTPHDAIFKGLLGKPEHARGVLRGIVPAAVAEAIDWETLTAVSGNFVDLELRQQFTDLLFSARWRDGSELLAYFLFEHLSAPPKTRDGPMAYRMLRYKVRIWEDWFSRNPEATALPMIIPIVMYHGQAPWSEPRLFGDVLAVPSSVRPAVQLYLVQFAYLLNDLSEISDDELRARAMTAVAKLVTLCLKHARTSPDFMGILGRWIDVVREVVQAPNGLSALAQVLCYRTDRDLDHTRVVCGHACCSVRQLTPGRSSSPPGSDRRIAKRRPPAAAPDGWLSTTAEKSPTGRRHARVGGVKISADELGCSSAVCSQCWSATGPSSSQVT